MVIDNRVLLCRPIEICLFFLGNVANFTCLPSNYVYHICAAGHCSVQSRGVECTPWRAHFPAHKNQSNRAHGEVRYHVRKPLCASHQATILCQNTTHRVGRVKALADVVITIPTAITAIACHDRKRPRLLCSSASCHSSASEKRTRRTRGMARKISPEEPRATCLKRFA